MDNHPYVHIATLGVSVVTLLLLLVSQLQIWRLRRERNEAVEKLILYMDQKTREINAHKGNGSA